MPKQRKSWSRSWIRPELRLCTEKAGKAIAKHSPKSPLTDGDVSFLAATAWFGESHLINLPSPDEDGSVVIPRGYTKRRLIKVDRSEELAWVVSKDVIGAGAALAAAGKEAYRINTTPLWIIRRVARYLSLFHEMQPGFHFPIETEEILARAAKQGMYISKKKDYAPLIKKAIRLEKAEHQKR